MWARTARRFLLAAGLTLCGLAPVAGADALPAWRERLMPAGTAWHSVPQDLVFNNDTEPQTLDPALMTGVPESRLTLALFEGLASYDPETLEPRPGLASSWEISTDHLDYVFHLRPGATFSNGEPLTAGTVRGSWLRVLEAATAAPYAYQLYPVAGAQAFHEGPHPDPATVGIVAVDDTTLRVHLAQPCPYFLDLCAFQTLMPVPLATIRAQGEHWTQPGHFAGNGPFRLTQWHPRSEIVMVPNDRYWGRSQIVLTSLTALPYDDVEAAYKKFQEGSLHWMPGVPLAKMDEVRRSPEYYVMPFLGTYFYRFNCGKPPFDDVRVRKAFSLAIDRRVITEHVLRAGQLPATWFCPDCAGYHHVPGEPYDPDAARQLLAQAGYGPGGRPFPVVELLSNTSEAHRQVSESVIQQWHENLGVVVSPRFCEWKVYLDQVDHEAYQIARGSWIGDYTDPNTFFDMWVSGGGNNHTHWSSASYDALLHQSQAEADPLARRALFSRLEELLVSREFPILPLYIYVNQGLLSEHVHGWYENVRDLHPFQYLWLE